MKHRPARLTTAAFLSFCVLLAWGKTSAAGPDAALHPRRSLRGQIDDETNAYHDHQQQLHGLPDQHGRRHHRALRPANTSPLDQPGSLDNTAALAPGLRGLETVSDVVGQPQLTPVQDEANHDHSKYNQYQPPTTAAPADAKAVDDGIVAVAARPGKIELTKVTIPGEAPGPATASKQDGVLGNKAAAPAAEEEQRLPVLLPLPEAGGPGRAKMTQTPALDLDLDMGPLASVSAPAKEQLATTEAAAVGRIPLEPVAGTPPPPETGVADKEPHLPPPGTYFQRNRPNTGNNRRSLEEQQQQQPEAGKIALESVPAPSNEADKEPHLPPPGTYFQRNRPNGGNRALEEANAPAAPAVGKITLESVAAPPAEAAKDPLRPPSGTYFERNRPNNGNNRLLADNEAPAAPEAGKVELESIPAPAEAAKDPHLPPGTYFERNRPGRNGNSRALEEQEKQAGKIALESVPAPNIDGDKEPHARPPSTYFSASRAGNGG